MMKTVIILLTVSLLSGCATNRAACVGVRCRAPSPGTTLPSEGIESVRYAENLKAYPLARYIDPNNRRLMHEVTPSIVWKPRPGGIFTRSNWRTVERGPDSVLRARVSNEAPERDELIVELNRQKEATKAVLQGTQAVSQNWTSLATRCSRPSKSLRRMSL